MKYEIKKRLRGTDGKWRSAFSGSIFTNKEGAEERMQEAIDCYTEYEYKMIESQHKFPYER